MTSDGEHTHDEVSDRGRPSPGLDGSRSRTIGSRSGGLDIGRQLPRPRKIGLGSRTEQGQRYSIALSNCAAMEHASDCRILASSPDCIAVAWDGAEPINQAHAKSGGGRDVVVPAAIAAAGPHANDVSSRCASD